MTRPEFRGGPMDGHQPSAGELAIARQAPNRLVVVVPYLSQADLAAAYAAGVVTVAVYSLQETGDLVYCGPVDRPLPREAHNA